MKLNTLQIVMAGMMGAIAVVLGASGWGFIPVPTPAGAATIMHVPAVLGGILGGPVVGLFSGLIFGIFSFMRPTAPMFGDPLVAILPRLFIGVTPYYVYRLVKKFNLEFSLVLAGIVGSFTNTLLVLGMAVILGYLPFTAAVPVAGMHGIPEAILSAIITVFVGRAVYYYQNNSN
ncbi:MAG: ECF transporter S component [Bacillota bacterium]